MKTFFVVNPRSANGETGRRWAEYQARIQRSIPDAAYAFTTGPMDAAKLAKKAIQDGFGCVVAVGGDGTINEVTNGFFDGEKALNPEAALGVLPRGTGGDFRKTFDWDTDLDESVQRLARANTRPFDVGHLEFVGHDGQKATRLFANICSFGASGQVDAEVNKSSKALGGALAFTIGGAKALLKYSDAKVTVTFDGGAAETMPVTTLSVCNGRFFGGGMKVAPRADPFDGKFDITIWSGFGVKDFLFKMSMIRDGRHVDMAGVRTRTCTRIEATSDREVLIDCDGEQPGRLPCAMKILPSAIRLCV
jgi:YegS/Rv2252/BmrU family lipid kinase